MKGVWPWRSPNAPIQPTKSWDVNPKDDRQLPPNQKKQPKILWNFEKKHGMMNFREDCGPIFILRNNTHTSPFLVLKDHVSVALISCYCGPGIDFWRKKRVREFAMLTCFNFQNDLTHQLMLLLLPKYVNSWCVSRSTLESMYINVLRFEFTFSNLRFLRVVTLDFPKRFQQKRIIPTIKVEKSHGSFQLMNFLQKLDFCTTEMSFRTPAQWSNLHLLQPILLYLPPPWCKENGQTYISYDCIYI